MTAAYFESGHSIKHMLTTMFNADFFKSETSRFARIKSPAEMVVGTLRLAGSLKIPSTDTYAAAGACGVMGQGLLSPPSVEGWQGGSEWINTGTYMQRVNFVGRILSDPSRPGVRAIIDRIARSAGDSELSPEELVDVCLDVLGPLETLDSTRGSLVDYASKYGRLSFSDEQVASRTEEAVVALIQVIVSTQEYQMA